MTVDAEIAQKIEHLFELGHVGLFVDRRVRRDLIAEKLRHFDCDDAFLEDALTLDDQIVRSLRAIEMNVPVHPIARRDRRLGRIFWPLANVAGVFVADQPGLD